MQGEKEKQALVERRFRVKTRRCAISGPDSKTCSGSGKEVESDSGSDKDRFRFRQKQI